MKNMSKLLALGDIHLHFEKAQRIIEKFASTHKIVLIGDYFDNWGDTPELNASTAHWLKTTMNEHPEWVYLMGNHCFQYRPDITVACSGFSIAKKQAINEVMTIEDWNKLKYFHHENGWWFSHAGLTKYWFQHPLQDDINEAHVQKTIDNALEMQRTEKTTNAVWASDRTRGGTSPFGGLLWCDWRRLDIISNVKQIVGHTPVHRITTVTDTQTNACNINIDCSSQTYLGEVLEIDENGKTKIIDTSLI